MVLVIAGFSIIKFYNRISFPRPIFMVDFHHFYGSEKDNKKRNIRKFSLTLPLLANFLLFLQLP